MFHDYRRLSQSSEKREYVLVIDVLT